MVEYQMVNCQIRIRTETRFDDIEYVKGWLLGCLSGFAFEHDKEGNHHYHIYLFGIEIKPDSIRKTLGKYLPKQNYSVKTMAGPKNDIPLDPMVAWQYASAPDSNPQLVWIRGIDESQKERYIFGATAFYEQQENNRRRANEVVTNILVLNEEKTKVDRTWQRLMTELIETPGLYNDKTIPQIKAKIAASYLRQLKAVPRPSDLHRYAVSLFYIVKHNLHTDPDAPLLDSALYEEYA